MRAYLTTYSILNRVACTITQFSVVALSLCIFGVLVRFINCLTRTIDRRIYASTWLAHTSTEAKRWRYISLYARPPRQMYDALHGCALQLHRHCARSSKNFISARASASRARVISSELLCTACVLYMSILVALTHSHSLLWLSEPRAATQRDFAYTLEPSHTYPHIGLLVFDMNRKTSPPKWGGKLLIVWARAGRYVIN